MTAAGDAATPYRHITRPIAASAVLSLYGFAGSIGLIAAWTAGWYGNEHTPARIAPLVLTLGGIVQLAAGMLAFRARQWVAAAVANLWASEHAAWALLYLLVGAGAVAAPGSPSPALGMWYLVLGGITSVAAVAALGTSLASTVTFAIASLGGLLSGLAELWGIHWLAAPGSWLLVACAIGGWYTASGMLLHATTGRWILPVGQLQRTKRSPRLRGAEGEPGTKREL
jgi:hypothetical protein